MGSRRSTEKGIQVRLPLTSKATGAGKRKPFSMKIPGPNKQVWLRCLMALWALLACIGAGANAPGEYDVKIVYLYNFTKFVTWPDNAFKSPSAPLNICIMGDLPNLNAVHALQNKTSHNRDIVVTLLHPNGDDSQCHILFFTKTVDFAVAEKMLTSLKHPTLIVGETAGFAKNEGTIGFVMDDRRRVRIEINLANAKSQDITIRAQLLEIARKVYRDQEGT